MKRNTVVVVNIWVTMQQNYCDVAILVSSIWLQLTRWYQLKLKVSTFAFAFIVFIIVILWPNNPFNSDRRSIKIEEGDTCHKIYHIKTGKVWIRYWCICTGWSTTEIIFAGKWYHRLNFERDEETNCNWFWNLFSIGFVLILNKRIQM